ncbi:hypothetical protein QFC22_001105 [Naganishia vaughanmartiniae]|uniref:Uncharacterized protein n=1 Tax=Naganishia vaughanmartiniae TaxID=1424756 RepID=A0ACC2XLP1_9TREE|nr:hypothetical protein QFC22_001105 [Naganishia vaughanmartiniae]
MVNSQTSAAASQPMQSRTMTPEYTNDSSLSDKSTSSDTQLRPFPTDNLAPELVHLILYHVLSEPDFGGNGRWASRDEATREKLQWSRAHKVSQPIFSSETDVLKMIFLQQRAAVHKKFSLIHRSWTPYVLRSLYRSPRLTSKFAIQHLTDCLQHPEKLWGVEVSKETGKVIGGVVGDRRDCNDEGYQEQNQDL